VAEAAAPHNTARSDHKQQCLLHLLLLPLFCSLKLNPQFSQTLQPTSPQTFFHLHSPQTLSSKTMLSQTGHNLSTFTLTSSQLQTPLYQPHTLFSSSPQHSCTKLLCRISPSLPLKHSHTINETV